MGGVAVGREPREYWTMCCYDYHSNGSGQVQASSTGIGPMPTQTSSRRLSHLTGS